jgi:hypothetical protein
MQDEAADPASTDPVEFVPVSPQEVADALAYALRYDERGRPSRSAAGWDFATGIAAEHLAAYLTRAGYVVMRRIPGLPHST